MVRPGLRPKPWWEFAPPSDEPWRGIPRLPVTFASCQPGTSHKYILHVCNTPCVGVGVGVGVSVSVGVCFRAGENNRRRDQDLEI